METELKLVHQFAGKAESSISHSHSPGPRTQKQKPVTDQKMHGRRMQLDHIGQRTGNRDAEQFERIGGKQFDDQHIDQSHQQKERPEDFDIDAP